MKNYLIKLLLWVGFTSRKHDGSLHWPFSAPKSWHMIRYYWKVQPWPYVFRNRPGCIKWRKGRLLPWRWGFGWLGFEFGDRGSDCENYHAD